ncbi:MAG: sulfatase-like hydrolase/transferase [bacterium]|nr:sulfatase-like hydrolase/transferase [bacterium]
MKPHILLIYSDQHRYDCMAHTGHPLVRTPNLDQLSREGVSFTHAFTPSPICVPARCSLLSGQWPSQHGVIFNYDGETFKPLDNTIPTCSSLLQAAGYHTVHVGRWHVDPHRGPHFFGFHDYIPEWHYKKWRAAQGIPPVPPHDWFGADDPHISPDQSPPAWGARQVLRWFDIACELNEPLFIHWHTTEPHLPCVPPAELSKLYVPSSIPPWPGFTDPCHHKPLIQRQMRHTWQVHNLSWHDWAPTVARYLATITCLDHAIGIVLHGLRARGLDDNTLVIYSADHGDMCGNHGMIDKHYVMYDDVIRVPLILRWPAALPAGTVRNAFVSNALDLAATFCDAAGLPLPASFAGQSLLPLARGDASAQPRQDIFASYAGNQFGAFSQRMVRDYRWKYVWNPVAQDELYDLASDPAELHNRVTDPSCASELARLQTRLLWWMEHTHDRLLNHWTRLQLSGHRIHT